MSIFLTKKDFVPGLCLVNYESDTLWLCTNSVYHIDELYVTYISLGINHRNFFRVINSNYRIDDSSRVQMCSVVKL